MSQPGNTSRYQQRKEAEICTCCGKEPQSEDSLLGQRCLKKERRRQRNLRRKQRRGWARKRKCTRCGGKRSPRSSWGCARCVTELGVSRSIRFVTAHVTSKEDRIASRTVAHVEADGHERERYHGKARRGAPSRQQTDAEDLDDAIRELVTARDGLAFARSDQCVGLSRVELRGVLEAALAHVHLAERFCEEVRMRNRYDPAKSAEP